MATRSFDDYLKASSGENDLPKPDNLRARLEENQKQLTESRTPFYVGMGIASLILYLESASDASAEDHGHHRPHGGQGLKAQGQRGDGHVVPESYSAQALEEVPALTDLCGAHFSSAVAHISLAKLTSAPATSPGHAVLSDAEFMTSVPELVLAPPAVPVAAPLQGDDLAQLETGNAPTEVGVVAEDVNPVKALEPENLPQVTELLADAKLNRKPVTQGPVVLRDSLLQTAGVIAFTDFIGDAFDPDGDKLAVRNVISSAGAVKQVDGGFQLEDPQAGLVTFTYEIWDGAEFVEQSATVVFSDAPAESAPSTELKVQAETLVVASDVPDVVQPVKDKPALRAPAEAPDADADGAHKITGSAATDVLTGGAGEDVIEGGAGNDVLDGGAGVDELFGGIGQDLLKALLDGAADMFDGGAGQDTLSFAQEKRSVVFDLDRRTVSGGLGGASEDRFLDIEVFEGGSGNDVFKAVSAADAARGILQFNSEGVAVPVSVFDAIANLNDILHEPDVQSFAAGKGVDRLDYSAAGSDIIIDVEAGIAAGHDIGVDRFTSVESFVTGKGDDVLIADGQSTAAESFLGGGGFDTLSFDSADAGLMIDVAAGVAEGAGIGTDDFEEIEQIVAGTGDDTIIIGAGAVTVDGNAGEDLFVFLADAKADDGNHHIKNFEVGDVVRVSQFDIFERAAEEVKDAFEQIYGDGPVAGDFADGIVPIRIRHELSDDLVKTFIDADIDADQAFDISIALDGHHDLTVAELDLDRTSH
jgi:Ca2+-binding RTX toxin-like protein